MDTFSFLVTTDNHMGFQKSDNLRRKDAFMAFAEALKIARDNDVDFILLGGDLFHENKPSASIEHKCIKIIRQHMNAPSSRGTSFQRVRGTFSHFRKVSHANFEDPHITVPHPIMTIHGNHDDPTGPESRSVCEKLATCGLLNYFGAVTSLKDIAIKPIILKKGEINIALYGLGFIPDYKLRLAFERGEIIFVEPPENTYNVLVIHQNRVPHSRDKLIEDELLPTFFHLIIRGHEHDAQSPEPLPYSKVDGLVYQPGSTVATSITPGEMRSKKVGLFQIKLNDTNGDSKTRYKTDYKLIEIKCCRRVLIRDITQKSIFNYIKNTTGSKRVTAVEFKSLSQDYIEKCIEEMLSKYEVELNDRKAEMGCPDEKKSFKMDRLDLPLMRVRIEYSTKNQRFREEDVGNKLYPGRVANKNVILFKKQKLQQNEDGTMDNVTFQMDDIQADDDDEPIEFDVIDLSKEKNITIDAMIEDYFKFKLKSEQLQALSLAEYTMAMSGSIDEGNVISKLLTKMKRDMFEEYRRLIQDNDVALTKFYEIQMVEDWFKKTLSEKNLDLRKDEGGDKVEAMDEDVAFIE